MAGMTNICKSNLLSHFFRSSGGPSLDFRAVLITGANVPGPDTIYMSDVVEIAGGNGYTSGGHVIRGGVDGFPWTEIDDEGDKGILRLKDITFTASGGSIPSSAAPARYLLVVQDISDADNRKVYMWFDLSSDIVLSDGQKLEISGMVVEIMES